MLILHFYIEDSCYALEYTQVVEVVPMVALRKIPHAPDYVAGLFNYRGRIVPVIDLRHLAQDHPCRAYLSTRIILVNYPGKDGDVHILGLMAERVTETTDKQDAAFADSGIKIEQAPYLGKIAVQEDGEEMVQYIRVEHVLPEALSDVLFADQKEAQG